MCALNPAIMNRVKLANHREELNLRQQLQQLEQNHAGTMGQMNQDYVEVLQDLRSQRYQELRNSIRKRIEKRELEAQEDILNRQMTFFHVDDPGGRSGDPGEGQEDDERSGRRGSRGHVKFTEQGKAMSRSLSSSDIFAHGDKGHNQKVGMRRAVTLHGSIKDTEEQDDHKWPRHRGGKGSSHMTTAPLVAFRLNSEVRSKTTSSPQHDTVEKLEIALEEEASKFMASAGKTRSSRPGRRRGKNGGSRGHGEKLEFYIAPQTEDARKKKIQHDVSRLATIRKAEQVQAYQGALRRTSSFIRGEEGGSAGEREGGAPSTLGEKFLQKQELDKEEVMILDMMKQRRNSQRPDSSGLNS